MGGDRMQAELSAQNERMSSKLQGSELELQRVQQELEAARSEEQG